MAEMTDDELRALMTKIGDDTIDVYGLHCNHAPRGLIITAMAGALAACASEAGIGRNMVVAVLGLAFEEMEAKD